MKVINSFKNIEINHLSVLSIGFFDGMHIGHKKIINLMHSAFSDRKKIIITFDKKIKNKNDSLFRIEKRLKSFKENKIDLVILLEFSKELSLHSYQDFLKEIKKRINFDRLILGETACFGHGQKGNKNNIKAIEKDYGFKSIYLLEESIDKKIISSTYIKKAIFNGQISLANKMLGYSYEIDSTLIAKDENRLIFKILNYIIPPKGIYLFEIKDDPYYITGTIDKNLLIITKNNGGFIIDKSVKFKLLKKI